MSVLRIPTIAARTMPHVQIQRDCSSALVILDSAGMDTTVQGENFSEYDCFPVSASKTYMA